MTAAEFTAFLLACALAGLLVGSRRAAIVAAALGGVLLAAALTAIGGWAP